MSEILELLEVKHPEPEYDRMVRTIRQARHRRREAIIEHFTSPAGQSYLVKKMAVWG